MLRRLCQGGSAILLGALGGCQHIGEGSPAPPEPSASLQTELNVAVPMRDGVVLRADVYRPSGTGRHPVLVYRTPYGKTDAARSYRTHAAAVARGYAVVLQDVRGRYDSDGTFDAYRQEGKDGYDTIEWAAAQPWSNGRVGTYGLSYPGAVQWLAALEAPPHLQAMVPAMTYSSPRAFFYANGIFDLSWLSWIYINIAPDTRRRLDLPGPRDEDTATRSWPEVADAYRSWRPLRDLPWLRLEAPFYFEWLEHPPEDAWWDWAELRGRYGRVSAAVLNLSGWYDDGYGTEGAVTNFNGLLASRAGGDDARAHLVLGPWVHGIANVGRGQVGALDFGPAARLDYDDLVLDFFDRYLREIPNAFVNAPPVRHFVMGANEWRSETAWPPPNADMLPLYLARGSGPHGGLQRTPPQGHAESTSFPSDPGRPVTDPHEQFGPQDNRALLDRPDVLTFETQPLRSDVVVSGAIVAEINASCDCRDFDLWVRLQDVHPDGRAFNLMSPGNDVVRASYRDPAAGRQSVAPDAVYLLRLPSLLTSVRLGAGHRLRVQLSGAFAPHISRNLQTGLSEITSAESRPATITIHHDAQTASRLLLPVVSGAASAW